VRVGFPKYHFLLGTCSIGFHLSFKHVSCFLDWLEIYKFAFSSRLRIS
jgi:hypothetical protein